MSVTMNNREEDELFSIGEMSRAFEVTPRALRFYEDKGLLSPHRAGVVRMYSSRDRARLKLILRGKRVGLTLMEIRDLLDVYNSPTSKKSQLKRVLEKYREQAETLKQQRAEIDAAIVELRNEIAMIEAQMADNGAEVVEEAPKAKPGRPRKATK